MKVLPSISKLMKEQLKEILAEKYYREICDEIDKKAMIENRCSSERYNLSLKCENFENQSIVYGYNIDINSGATKESKIFRISAQNQRYKTTSVLIMAILLGYNIKTKDDIMIDILSFEDKKNILNNDRLLQRMANLKEVIFNIDNGQDVNFINNRIINFSIKNNCESILSINIIMDKIYIKTYYEEKIIEIKGNKVYEEYLQYINNLSLFTPHMVSKGRDFVKYILVEETKKYWVSLDLMIKLLQNKLVKWSEDSRKLSSKEISERISALEFLKEVEIQIPKYLKLRKEYLEYLKIQKYFIEKENEKVNIDMISQFKTQLDTLRIEEDTLLNEVNDMLRRIYNKIHTTYYGDHKNQLYEINKILDEQEIASCLNVNILTENKDMCKIRRIRIVHEHDNKIVNTDINDISGLVSTLTKLDNLQKDFYEAQNLFKASKVRLRNSIDRLNILKSNIQDLNAKINIYKEYINKKERLNTLKMYLEDYLPEFETLQDFQIEMIENNIIKAKSSNLNNIEQSISYYEQMLEKDTFDIEKLEKFFTNLTDAYYFFGSEISKLSKKEENYTIKKPFNNNKLRDRLIEIFEEDIIERCSFFLKSNNKEVKLYKIRKYSFWEQLFYSEDNEILDLQSGLSGGTDSVMTVYSMAASLNESKYGNIVFVDEWGDVSQSFHKEAVKELCKLNNFAFAIFVDINDGYDKINISSELGEELR